MQRSLSRYIENQGDAPPWDPPAPTPPPPVSPPLPITNPSTTPNPNSPNAPWTNPLGGDDPTPLNNTNPLGGGGVDDPPPPPPPPTADPLAIDGTFANPGTAQARPFWTPGFNEGRVAGVVSGPTGPGVPLSSQSGDSGQGGLDDYIRKVVVGRHRGRV